MTSVSKIETDYLDRDTFSSLCINGVRQFRESKKGKRIQNEKLEKLALSLCTVAAARLLC